MIQGSSVLAIIPARGGSKGVLRKNIKMLAGKPLIAWTIEVAKQSQYIDRLILSSEDEEIIKVAGDWGCEAPFVRPKELAEDHTPGMDPILHALQKIEGYDIVVVLQPTSPLRTTEDIDHCIEKTIESQKPCVSLTETDKTPYWMYTINGNGQLSSIMGENLIARRQEAPKAYTLNGAVYVSFVKDILKEKAFLTKDTVGYVMDKNASHDIDTELDFMICEWLLKKNANHN